MTNKQIIPGTKLINVYSGEIKEVEKVGRMYFYFIGDKDRVSIREDRNGNHAQELYNGRISWSTEIEKYQELIEKRKILDNFETIFKWTERQSNVEKYTLEQLRQVESILSNKTE